MSDQSYVNSSDDVYSAFKIAHPQHKERIQALREKKPFVPVCLQMDLMTSCSHNCFFCAYRNVGFDQPHQGGAMWFDDKKNIPKDLTFKIVDDAIRLGVKGFEWTGGGESTLWKWFGELMYHIGDRAENAIVTNGEHLTSDKVDALHRDTIRWIRFSMDSYTKETHEKVHFLGEGKFARKPRKDTWDKILSNINYVLKRKRTDWNKEFRLGISYVITKDNIHEIDQAAKFWRNLGVDNIRYTWTFDINYDGALTQEQRDEAYKRLELAKQYDNGDFRVFGWQSRLNDYKGDNNFRICGYQYGTMQIAPMPDETIGLWACCITKYYPNFNLGDLRVQTLDELLLGKDRKVDFDPKGCPNCWLSSKNRFMIALADGTEKDYLGEEGYKDLVSYLQRKNPPHVNFP